MATGLDPTFGFAGSAEVVVVDDKPNDNTYIYANVTDRVVQPDGKIVVAGVLNTNVSNNEPPFENKSTTDLLVARFNADGTPDTSFGSGGRATLPVTLDGKHYDLSFSAEVALTSDGKILVASTANNRENDVLDVDQFVVARLNSNGSVDSSFGSGGVRPVKFDNSAFLSDLAVAPDGKIVMVGSSSSKPTTPGTGSSDYAIARLNADGSVDNSFDGDGKRLVNISQFTSGDVQQETSDSATTVAIQSDGKIVIAGTATTSTFTPVFSSTSDIGVVRLNADGSNDGSFDSDGVQVVAFNLGGSNQDDASQVAVAPDGKIVVVGSATLTGSSNNFDERTIYQLAVTRLTSTGAFDSTFDGDGKATLPFSHGGETFSTRGSGLEVQKDGSLLLGGSASSPSRFVGILAKLTPAGALDPSFGPGGVVALPTSAVQNVTTLPSGKVLLFGGGTLNRTTAPTPVVVSSVASVKGKAKGKRQNVSGVVLTFNTALNSFLAGNKSTYSIRSKKRGPDIDIKNVAYDAIARTVTITLKRPLQTTKPLFVTINSLGIIDADGQVLNGGQPLTINPEFPVTAAGHRRKA